MMSSLLLTFAVHFALTQAAKGETRDQHIARELEAAWKKAAAADNGNSLIPPQHYDEFMHLVELRLGLSIPERWECMMGGRPGHKYAFVHEGDWWGNTFTVNSDDVVPTALGVTAPEGVQIRNKRAKVQITTRAGKLLVDAKALPNGFFRTEDRAKEICNVQIRPERSFLTLITCESESDFPMLCIDTVSGTVLWEEDVISQDHNVGVSCQILGHNRVDIDANAKWVGVFGRWRMGPFLDVFDARTGKRLIRLPPVKREK